MALARLRLCYAMLPGMVWYGMAAEKYLSFITPQNKFYKLAVLQPRVDPPIIKIIAAAGVTLFSPYANGLARY